MQYTQESKITPIDGVTEFFCHLANERQVSCATYNHLMDDSFDVCEKNGADIYAIELDYMQKAMA